jgi:hypothetical protein
MSPMRESAERPSTLIVTSGWTLVKRCTIEVRGWMADDGIEMISTRPRATPLIESIVAWAVARSRTFVADAGLLAIGAAAAGWGGGRPVAGTADQLDTARPRAAGGESVTAIVAGRSTLHRALQHDASGPA